jgi:hypothetical protein
LEVAGGVPEIFETEFSYNPRPLQKVPGSRLAIIEGTTIGDTYLSNSVPYVAVFKQPVDPKTLAFRSHVPYFADFKQPVDRSNSDFQWFGHMVQKPDLQLIPSAGSASMMVVKNPDEDFLRTIGLQYKRISMPHDDWSPSSKIVALKDLEGAQAIIYCPYSVCKYAELREVWDATQLRGIALVINGQRIDFDEKHLAVAATSYGKVYSYVLPQSIAF